MVKCFVYARLSTDEQAQGNYNSIESQIDICKHYIQIQQEKNWQFAGSYTDPGFSGKNLERPGIQQLISDVRAGKIDVVIVYKIERLVRSIRDFYALWDIFEAHNVTFVSATQQFDSSNAMGKLMLNVLLSFAQFERENTAKKTKDKMKQRARMGMWHGGWMPYGYNHDKEEKKLFINTKEAEAVKKIYSLFLDDKKPSHIANELNNAGYLTKSREITTKDNKKKVVGANRFNEDMVKKILTSPIYKGYVHLGGEEFKGKHEAIIEESIWSKASKQFMTKNPRKMMVTKDDHIHLLKGILMCGECDTTLTPYPSGKKDKDGRPYLYYACGRVVDFGKHSECKVRLLPAREFEKAIKEALQELGKNKALIQTTIKSTTQYNKNRLKPLEQEKEKTIQYISKNTAEINHLVKILKSQDMVGKEITEEYKKLLKENAALENQKEKLTIDIERCRQETIDAELIIKTLENFDKVINTLSLEDQKDLFHLLFKPEFDSLLDFGAQRKFSRRDQSTRSSIFVALHFACPRYLLVERISKMPPNCRSRVKEIRVWSFDPEKEKAPAKTTGAFITKIRTKWYRIKLDLYQFPEIDTHYRSISCKKASSDSTTKWLPREGSNLGPIG